MLWLFSDLTRVDGGPIPSLISGSTIGNSGNGIETGSYHQKAVLLQYSPRQYWTNETLYPWAITLPTKIELIRRARFWRSRYNGLIKVLGLRPGFEVHLNRGHQSNRDRVKHCSSRLGSKVHCAYGPALYNSPPPFDLCPATESEPRTIWMALVTPPPPRKPNCQLLNEQNGHQWFLKRRVLPGCHIH